MKPAAVREAKLDAAVIVQILCLDYRLRREVPAGPKVYAVKSWLATSLPILLVWGFYTLLTYTDVIVLSQFQPDAEVALYYAASKTLADSLWRSGAKVRPALAPQSITGRAPPSASVNGLSCATRVVPTRSFHSFGVR